MSERFYKASLSQSQGREGWSVIFKHPVLLDRATGKPGRRVRRGLGTKDRDEALRLIAELNQLLADRTFWEASSRPTAQGRFAATVVDIFYHDLVPELTDPFATRDAVIPLPRSSDSGYRQVLLMGTTGSGKTTLVRQLIGTDPVRERFPATSTSKTTVADTEIVFADGPFRVVVTFLPRDQVRDYVEECMSAAVLAAYRGESDRAILRRLLNHVNQRFRLSYVLGGSDSFIDEIDKEGLLEWERPDVPGSPGLRNLLSSRELMRSSLPRLHAIALRTGLNLREETIAADPDDRIFEEQFEETFDQRLRDDEQFQALEDEFVDEVEHHFIALSVGQVEKTKQGWPRSWTWQHEDRAIFLDIVELFTSNQAALFGRLLTPLVNGFRVAGPFQPEWTAERPKLVLFDVEGLAHTPDSAASLPTALTRRLEDVDAVLLVDNAAQPLQAAPVAAMRNIACSGQARKLIVCFTHFDAVVGDNLSTFRSKEEHVLASSDNALSAIGEQLGSFAERALRHRLELDCFFLAGLQQRLAGATLEEKRTTAGLHGLLRAIERTAAQPKPVASRPVYDRMNLAFALKQAVEEFHAEWNARLGRQVKSSVFRVHWARIKAMARRLAMGWDDGYMELRPLADLHRELQENIYRFIQSPLGWSGAAPSDDEKQQVFDSFAESVSAKVMLAVIGRMRDEMLQDWQKAYGLSGRGSSFARARVIADNIYEKAAPVPDVSPSPDRNKFMREIVEAVRMSAEALQIALK